MDTNESVKILEGQGGNLWEKNGMRRVYFDSETVLARAGFSVDRYNTGNICSAELKGAKISNSEARRIEGCFSAKKFWFDLTDQKFHTKDSSGTGFRGYEYLADEFFAAMEAAIK